ncbi:MAG: hypothetical protein U0835_13635 [Isosphaeraceae bacterium]
MAVSPDGHVIATGHRGKTSVSLWSAETGDPIGLPLETQTELTAVA